jgi:hypothetical protein
MASDRIQCGVVRTEFRILQIQRVFFIKQEEISVFYSFISTDIVSCHCFLLLLHQQRQR